MINDRCTQVLDCLGILGNDPDNTVDALHSRVDDLQLALILQQHDITRESFWSHILYGQENSASLQGNGIACKPRSELNYEILPYNHKKHDISKLARKFEEEVIGGERESSPEHKHFYVARDGLTSRILGYISFIIVDEGTDIGSNLGCRAYFLDEIMVDQTFRRQKVGKKLHDYLVSLAKVDDVHCIFTSAHIAVAPFFEKLGYKQLGNNWSNAYGQMFYEMAYPIDEIGRKAVGEINISLPLTDLNVA